MDKTSQATDLCLECGLCCQGVPYSRAMLATSEMELARELALSVDAYGDGLCFHLPCPQHQGNRCVTYQRRPQACSAYQCELLQCFLAGEIALEESLTLMRQAKELRDSLWVRLPDGKVVLPPDRLDAYRAGLYATIMLKRQ